MAGNSEHNKLRPVNKSGIGNYVFALLHKNSHIPSEIHPAGITVNRTIASVLIKKVKIRECADTSDIFNVSPNFLIVIGVFKIRYPHIHGIPVFA